MTSVIHAEVPDRLWQQAQAMVEQGGFTNIESLVAESLRRYIDSHQQVLTDEFVRGDVEWGLNGRE